MTVYVFGRPMPSEELADPFSRAFLSFVRESFPDFVPTTYEAARAFIDKELLKPEGQRDLRRAICLLVVVKIPDDQDSDLHARTWSRPHLLD
jgi:hypothetical protein